jgi:flagellar assembly protein FliH
MSAMNFVPARDFDDELDAERREDEHRRNAVYTVADMESACAEAREAGRATGRAEGDAAARAAVRATAAERTLAALEAVAPAVDTLIAEADRHRTTLQAQLIEFVLSVFDRVLPELVRSQAAKRVEAEVRRAATMALGSARLTLHLPPDAATTFAPDLKRRIREAGYEGRVEIAADPGLAPGDIRADWDNGFMDYSYAAICTQIIGALTAALPRRGPAPTEPAEQEEATHDR